MNRIHTFASGAKIDLEDILMIGSPTVNQEYDVNLPIYMKGRETPVKLFMYSTLTPPTEDEKSKCKQENLRLTTAWEVWKTNQKKEADEYKKWTV